MKQAVPQAQHLSERTRRVLGVGLATWVLELNRGAKQLPHCLQLHSRLRGSLLHGRTLQWAAGHQGGALQAAEAIVHPRICLVSRPRKPRGHDADYGLEHSKHLLTVYFLLKKVYLQKKSKHQKYHPMSSVARIALFASEEKSLHQTTKRLQETLVFLVNVHGLEIIFC